MRDMLAGFRIRDLDFAVEGNALKVAKALGENAGATTVLEDDNRKSAELVFPTGVTAQIAMSRQEKSARAGGKAQVSAATIQEDLRGRDFTCNAIALSLNKASRGLLLDPMNGLADIERHELRASTRTASTTTLRGCCAWSDSAYAWASRWRSAPRCRWPTRARPGWRKPFPPRALAEELRRIAAEDNPADILRALGEAGLLTLFSPVLAGPKINLPGITRFERISRLLPDDARSRTARLGPFLWALTERLTPKEKQALIATTDMPKAQVDLWQKLEARAQKLETALRSARIRKASQVYHLVSPAAPDEVLFLLYHSAFKPVQERLRNYYQKYLPAIQEITAEEWAALEGKPGTPRQHKAREEFIANRLDRRPPRKPATPEIPGPAGAPAPAGPPSPAAAPAEAGVVKRTRS